MKETAVALKFKETFYKKPDGTLVFHAIPKVDGDAPAYDFTDEVTSALRSEKAQMSALEEHKCQINGSR